MNFDYTELLRNLEKQQRENNPLRDFQKRKNAAAGNHYEAFGFGQKAPGAAAQPSGETWFRATVYGFIGHVSARGWTVSRRRLGAQHVFTWRSSRGQLLETKITGQDIPRVFAHACGLLAGWEPELMYWQAAFKEVGVPTSTR